MIGDDIERPDVNEWPFHHNHRVSKCPRPKLRRPAHLPPISIDRERWLPRQWPCDHVSDIYTDRRMNCGHYRPVQTQSLFSGWNDRESRQGAFHTEVTFSRGLWDCGGLLMALGAGVWENKSQPIAELVFYVGCGGRRPRWFVSGIKWVNYKLIPEWWDLKYQIIPSWARSATAKITSLSPIIAN